MGRLAQPNPPETKPCFTSQMNFMGSDWPDFYAIDQCLHQRGHCRSLARQGPTGAVTTSPNLVKALRETCSSSGDPLRIGRDLRPLLLTRLALELLNEALELAQLLNEIRRHFGEVGWLTCGWPPAQNQETCFSFADFLFLET